MGLDPNFPSELARMHAVTQERLMAQQIARNREQDEIDRAHASREEEEEYGFPEKVSSASHFY